MAKANTDLLGAAGQVAEEEHVIRISAKSLRNYLIIGGSILVLISAIAVFALVGGKSKDVAGSAGVADGSTVSQSASTESISEDAVPDSEGGSAIVIPGPFSRSEIMDMSLLTLKNCILERTDERRITPQMMHFDEGSCSMKYLRTEKGVDKNGIKRDVCTVEAHFVGSYDSNLRNVPVETFYDISFIVYAIKTDYKPGYKILNKDITSFKIWT